MDRYLKEIERIIGIIEDDIKTISLRSNITEILGYSDPNLEKEFSVIIGTSLKNYILYRKLYTCSLELLNGYKGSLTKLAMDYGFDSYDSFTKHFKRFHGFPPSKTFEMKRNLKAYLKYGAFHDESHISNNRFVYMNEFTVQCHGKVVSYTHGYDEISALWDQFALHGKNDMLAISKIDWANDDLFSYYVVDAHHNDEDKDGISLHIPASLWDVYIIKGPYPAAAESFIYQVYSKYEKSSEYEPNLPYILEKHFQNDRGSITYECEIWISVKHVLNDPAIYLKGEEHECN